MKLLYKSLLILPVFFFAISIGQAQSKNIQTDSVTVNGVCDMCKDRIEEAAIIKGVKMAEWDKYAQKLTVLYKPKKTNLQTICAAVAKVGHDTDKVKATEEAYASLPDCCAYRNSELEVH
ncbi:heavy-metal-associated domain-containing protein [Membranihabitans maritimus]|uniref:heavy-metal-associated domain-containing protein n=1 Tax=Membranihabitans maritimus TaxID=2904244 RepID=UPI001F2C6A95|nr:hypothetical protein [Membranihabitans maritimus]